MTYEQKLDTLLRGLLSRVPQRFMNGSDNKILSFDYLCSILLKDEDMPSWEVEFLNRALIEDGYIEMVDADGVLIPNITHKGIKFIQDGGYSKADLRQKQQDELVRSTIKSNNRSMLALIVSIVATIIALASFIYQIIINKGFS